MNLALQTVKNKIYYFDEKLLLKFLKHKTFQKKIQTLLCKATQYNFTSVFLTFLDIRFVHAPNKFDSLTHWNYTKYASKDGKWQVEGK